jgi:hypothetical protein
MATPIASCGRKSGRIQSARLGRGTGAARPSVRGGRGAKAPLRSMGAQPSCRSMAAYAWSMGAVGRAKSPPVRCPEAERLGVVHGAKLLVWGMQRGAKLPPCQDERPEGAVARGTRAHLASGIATAFLPVKLAFFMCSFRYSTCPDHLPCRSRFQEKSH